MKRDFIAIFTGLKQEAVTFAKSILSCLRFNRRRSLRSTLYPDARGKGNVHVGGVELKSVSNHPCPEDLVL